MGLDSASREAAQEIISIPPNKQPINLWIVEDREMRFVGDGYYRNLTARRGEIRAAKRATRERHADALSRVGLRARR